MKFHPVKSFRDPVTRPRAIMWAGVLVMFVAFLWAAALVGTSFEWFCTRPCHMVHDDNTLAYEQSKHVNVSCVACHEPVEASPLTYTVMKIFVIPDLYATIAGTFEIPVNGDSKYAVETSDAACTQCHTPSKGELTPSRGIRIDHDVHTEKGITCTTCHNRVAHPEDDIDLVLGDRKHDDWMTMDACFRCHSLQSGAAPGACAACHTPGFKLTPATHDAAGWYELYGDSSGHATAAKEESAAVKAAADVFAEYEPIDEADAVGPILKPSSTIYSCTTCHSAGYCNDCHGLAMPHSEAFKKDHAAAGAADPESCAPCHARSAERAKGTALCNDCHHAASVSSTPWIEQHQTVVTKEGNGPCLECHEPIYCETCHVKGREAAAQLAQ